MSTLQLEMLSPERVTELWPVLEPHFDAACKAHEIAEDEMCAKDIYVLTQVGMAVVFVGFADGNPTMVMALQFNETNGRKGADIIAMGGKDLMKFKAAYWDSVLDWLRANKVTFVDAYAPERLAKLYTHKFGFTKSCHYVRMPL